MFANAVWATLDKVRDRVPDMFLVHGGDSKGADRLAARMLSKALQGDPSPISAWDDEAADILNSLVRPAGAAEWPAGESLYKSKWAAARDG